MRRRKKRTITTRLLVGLACLLVVAGVAGYSVSSYFAKPEVATTVKESSSAQPQPEAEPDRQTCIANLPIATKLSQKVMFAIYSDQIEEATPVLAELGVGGVIVMDEVPAEQLKQLRDAFATPPTIAVDQEGGTVQRYKSHGLLPSASEVPDLTTEEAYELYKNDSQYLAEVGITTNFAPVVDVESRTPSPLPDRMYSADANTIATYAGEAIKAMKEAGIQPVIKHFPGMGSASGNTDFVRAETDAFAELESRDLVPYRQLVSLAPDVMIGNMIVPGLTDGQPAIWSSEAVSLLRGIGYQDAVVYSDSLTAAGVPGTLSEAALKAWLAGIDVAVIVQTERTDVSQLVDSLVTAGTIRFESDTTTLTILNESVGRILARKNVDPCDLEPNTQ